jgi:hypothetical protein
MPDLKAIQNFNRIPDRQVRKNWKDFFVSQPTRTSAIHLIHPEGPALQIIKAFWVFYMTGKGERAKTKFYTSLNMETQYQLLTFGLPIQEVPVTATGTIKTKNHLLWIKGRKLIDTGRENESDLPFLGTFHPGIHDVLFSRGGNTTHFGNMEFRQFMASRIEAYNEGGRQERLVFRQELIELVHDNAGRFLQLETDGWWVEITNTKILMDKISNALYDFNRKSGATKNRQTTNSDTTKFLYKSKRKRTDSIDIGDSDGSGCFQHSAIKTDFAL